MTEDPDPILTIADFRRVFCVAGTAKHMQEHGVDFREFVKNGLPLSAFAGKGVDGYVTRILEAKAKAEQ